jgi:hypothetical protein
MIMKPELRRHIRQAVRSKYAWSGLYPLYLVMADGQSLCIDCARKNYKLIVSAHYRDPNSDWAAIGADINYEDTELYCAHCNEKIESAYGDD